MKVCMGKQKNLALLKAGQITQQEYDRRLAQSRSEKRGMSKGTKAMRKEIKAKNPVAVRAEKANRQNFKQQLASKSVVATSGGGFTPTGVSRDNIIQCYAETLVNPELHKCRYPDAFTRETAIFRSISTYLIPIRFGAAAYGRFSMCARPIMGDSSTPTHYQLAMADVDTDQYETADWTAASSYVKSVGGKDPRVDINNQYLTTPRTGFYELSALSTAPQTAPVDGRGFWGPDVNTSTVGPNTNNYSAQIGSTNSILLPYGNYIVTVSVNVTNGDGAAHSLILKRGLDGFTDTAPTDDNIGGTVGESDLLTLPAVVGSRATATIRFGVASRPGKTRVVLYIADVSTPTTVLGVGPLSSVGTSFSFAPLDIPGMFSPYTDSGAIEQIRPVAQSLLVTYTGAELLNGGTISMAYVPSNFVESNFFANARDNSFGNAQFVENLMDLDENFNDRLEFGAYGWWSPYDDTNMGFKSVSESNASEWPALICSGMFTPQSALAAGANQFVIRVELCTVYEFVTKSTAFDLEKYLGSQAIIDSVMQALSAQPHCMRNGNHKEWIRKVGSGFLNFVRNNKQLLTSLGSLAVSLI